MTRAALGRAAAPVVAAGVAWAALCLVLHGAGHAPSVVLLPVGREGYYLLQAFFVTPLLLVQWAVLSGVAGLVVRGAGWRDTAAAVGPAFGLVMLAYVATDAAIYAAAGFDGLTAAARWLGPIVALALWLAVGAALVRGTGAGRGRALLASLTGLVAQGIVAGPLLR